MFTSVVYTGSLLDCNGLPKPDKTLRDASGVPFPFFWRWSDYVCSINDVFRVFFVIRPRFGPVGRNIGGVHGSGGIYRKLWAFQARCDPAGCIGGVFAVLSKLERCYLSEN